MLRATCALALMLSCAYAQHGGGGGGGRPPGGPGGGGGRPGGMPGPDTRPESGGGPRPDGRGGPRDIPGPPPTSRRPVQDEIAELRRRIEQQTPFTPDERTVSSLATEYLKRAERIRDKKQVFVAQRFVASAAALSRALDDSQRLPEARTAPTREQASRRLEDVYLRVQQADYFLEQSEEPDAKPLADMARRWYQRALQSLDRDTSTARNFSDAADEVVAALENLAQAKATVRRGKK